MIGHPAQRLTRRTPRDSSGRTIKRQREDFEGITSEFIDLTQDQPLRRSDRTRPRTQSTSFQAILIDDDELQCTGESGTGGWVQCRDLRPEGLRNAADPIAWRRNWHEMNPGQRMCPSETCGKIIPWVKYITRHSRSRGVTFTCNNMTCRECSTRFCLTCGQMKGGSDSSGYHTRCGRQPPWLTDDMIGISNEDPRVQLPPPYHP